MVKLGGGDCITRAGTMGGSVGRTLILASNKINYYGFINEWCINVAGGYGLLNLKYSETMDQTLYLLVNHQQ